MRNLVSAIRAVKLYPPNNPVYSQSVKKSYETLDHFLETTPEYHVGVQKTFFSYLHTPVGKDAQLNRAIAQDLFAKGIREIVFSDGVTEDELLEFYRALALTVEEMAMKSGIASILWEKSTSHIRVVEAGLDDVITAKSTGGRVDDDRARTSAGAPAPDAVKKDAQFSRRTLVLGDLMTDPAGFGAGMIERAMQTRAENESVEDRLFTLYQDVGRRIQKDHPGQSDALFEGLARSVMSLELPYRDSLVAGRLYVGLDSETVSEQKDEFEKQVPDEIHEILAGRFSNAWNVEQVAVLLKKSSSKKPSSQPPQPKALADLEVVPISQDTIEIARNMAEYTAEEMEAIKIMGQVGMESDITEAAVRTLIFLLTLVKNPRRSTMEEKDFNYFSGAVRQLEDMLSYVLVKKDYDLATLIVRAFHMPVDPAFKPRMMEALKRNSSKPIIAATISELRNHSKGSSEYQSAYAYLSSLERESTEALLELLAEENDRTARIFLLDLVKDLGKNQLTLLGERLSDGRWYVVRNIVSILGESHADQALGYLYKVMNHKDVRIRQEVIKGLITIGGKKSASLLAKFLKDKDIDTQMMAVRGFAEIKGINFDDAKPLVSFLLERSLNKKEQALTLEAIRTLGVIGGPDEAEFLKGYTRIRWWRSRKLQKELSTAALGAMEKIVRRQDDGGSGKR